MSAPRSFPKGNGFPDQRRHSQELLSSSPRDREAATRLLSSSPSVPFFGGSHSRRGSTAAESDHTGGGNGNSNGRTSGNTPGSSWRDPSTLHNYRMTADNGDDNHLNADGSHEFGSSYNGGARLGSGSNYAGSNVSIRSGRAGSQQQPSAAYFFNTEQQQLDIPAEEASKVVKKHLVLNSPSRDSMDLSIHPGSNGQANNSYFDNDGYSSGGEGGSNHNIHGASEGVVDYNTAFKLPGGAITRDVYKWQADQENEQNRRGRSRSFHLPRSQDATISTLKQPGGMRRYHVIMKAEAHGRQANVFTKSFIDFLAMYGHFAGEDLDDEEGGDFEEAVYDEEGATPPTRRPDESEETPLIPKLPLQQQPPQGTASPSKAVFLLLKSFVGTGIMFLPKAFNNGGLLFSSIFLVTIAAISLFSFLLLVESRQVVPASFGDIGGHLYGPYMRLSVLVAIAVSQIGFVCAYMSFVATNLEALAHQFMDKENVYPSYFFVLVQLIIFIPLSMIRNIARLSSTAVVADIFICFGLIYLYYFDFFTLATNGLSDVVMFNAKDFGLFIGTAVFTFEGIGLIIPITESMKEPEKFPKVLSGVMIGITVLFTSIGALSYAAFGSHTQTVVLLNLPQESLLVSSVQALYSIAIMLSIPLQLFPAIRIMENGIFTRSGKYNQVVKWQKNLFRTVSLFVCALIAIYAGDDLDKFVSIVGSVACVPLAFMFPALFHFKTHPNRLTRCFDVALLLFGLVTMFYTTSTTIASWLED